MAIINKHSSDGHGATIVSRATAQYDPATFSSLRRPEFIEATAEQVLSEIKPMKLDFLDTPVIAVDTETFYTGVNSNRMPYNVQRRWIKRGTKYFPQDFPFCYSICDGTHSFVVYDTLENGFKEFKKLAPLLGDRQIAKVAHNGKYDMHMLANTGTELKGPIHDTMFLSKLCRADAFTHSLFDIAVELKKNGVDTVPEFERMLDTYKAANRVTDYRQFPKELMIQYTGGDTWNTLKVFGELYPRVLAGNQLDIYNVECEINIVTFKMERTGFKVDTAFEAQLIPELQAEVDEAERKIYETAGCTFNINSSQQLESVLQKLGYGHLIEYKAPTDTMLAKGILKGNASFDKYQMERLENEGVPLIKEIQQYKASEKLLNTFATKIFEMRDACGYLHCSMNTIEAKTGRFSISSPSMQNMPRRKDSRIRDAFVPPDGWKLYEFDYSSQESRILVHYSRSAYLMDILNNGHDIHKAVASLIYSIPYDEVTKELRGISKSVEFAIVYGAGPSKVSAMTGLSIEESTVAMKSFLKNAPEVDVFIKTANKVAKERKFMRTIRNRVVYLERGREYACVNYIIQGSAADSTKTNMARIYRFIKANNIPAKLVCQIHDSVVYYIKEDAPTEVLAWLKWLQTERTLFRVPVPADIGKCEGTWRSKADIEVQEQQPPQEMLDKMEQYDLWNEGILDIRKEGD